eukprot:m.230988 g.230988  ORF g.230988 m.230988 type:complete len:521 (-) comp18207_c0_seq1:26-1588(-)
MSMSRSTHRYSAVPMPCMGTPPQTIGGIGTSLRDIDLMGTPLIEHRESPLSSPEVETTPTGKRASGEAEAAEAAQNVPASASKRKNLDVLRDRANTLSQALLSSFTPDTRKREHPTLTRSVSTRSLLSRTKNRSQRKTSRGYFGSPHMRFSSTSQLWSETLGDEREAVLKSMSATELKRREAIHELISSEQQYLSDIQTLTKVFSDPMRKMEILNEEKEKAIFGNLPEIEQLHRDFFAQLKQLTVDMASISQPLAQCAARFAVYGEYCANLAYARYALEREKKQNLRFADFLEAGRDLKQSRRMDLWDLLDFPRRRLQRYPLLTKTVLHHTAPGTEEHANLTTAIAMLDAAITSVDATVARTSRTALIDLQTSLDFSHSEAIDLVEENKAMVASVDCRLKNIGKDVRLLLFPHVMLIVKEKKKEADQIRRVVVGEPIKLQFLNIEDPRELPDTQLKVRYTDPGARRGSLRGIQRTASLSSKSHLIEFASPLVRGEWLTMLTTSKINAANAATGATALTYM